MHPTLSALLNPSAPPGTLTRRLCSTTLGAQAMSVFFGSLVARQLTRVDGSTDRAQVYLWGGIGLAVLCVLAAGMMRSRVGVQLGWLCQLLTLAAAIVLPAMLIIVLIFGSLWWVCLTQGMKMDELTAQRDAAALADDNTQGGTH